MSAVMADGQTRTWRLVGAREAMLDPALPFFIQWENQGAQRERLAAARRLALHERAYRTISEIEVTGDEARLRQWLGVLAPPVRMSEGPSSIRSITLASDRGSAIVT